RAELLHGGERRIAVGGLADDLESVGLEELTRPRTEPVVVVDDQDAAAHRRIVTGAAAFRGTASHTSSTRTRVGVAVVPHELAAWRAARSCSNLAAWPASSRTSRNRRASARRR